MVEDLAKHSTDPVLYVYVSVTKDVALVTDELKTRWWNVDLTVSSPQNLEIGPPVYIHLPTSVSCRSNS